MTDREPEIPRKLGLLPQPKLLRLLHADRDPGPPYTVFGYTAEQMRAYAAEQVAAAHEAEVETLRKDAERLNWIERQNLDEILMRLRFDDKNRTEYVVFGDKPRPGVGPTLRAAIDAAMAGGKA